MTTQMLEIKPQQLDSRSERTTPAIVPPIDSPALPSTDSDETWGDRVGMQFWTFCFLLMGILITLDLVVGIFRK